MPAAEDPFNDLHDALPETYVFEPLESSFRRIALHRPSSLVIFNEDRQYYQLQRSLDSTPDVPLRDDSSMVVYMGLSYTDDPSIAYGLYFGPGSRFNLAERLNPLFTLSINAAYLAMFVKAMDVIDAIRGDDSVDFPISRVKFVTNSDYLTTSIDGVTEWKYTDGIDEDGTPIEHFVAMVAIANRLDDMRLIDNVRCQLWLLPYELISNATQLAASVL